MSLSAHLDLLIAFCLTYMYPLYTHVKGYLYDTIVTEGSTGHIYHSPISIYEIFLFFYFCKIYSSRVIYQINSLMHTILRLLFTLYSMILQKILNVSLLY